MKRDPSSHKGDYGHCLIIGGSDGMYGAPILSGEAAIRCGAGMVTIMVPSNHSGFFPNYSPELMVQTLKSCGSYLSPPALDTIKTYIAQRRVNALIVGMGLSKREESLSLVAAILENIDLPIVLDADGLSVLKKKNLSIKTKQLIVTPHPKECEQSLGLTIENYVSHPFSSLESLAKDHQCTIVYKTASTTISHPSGESFVNSTGNAGMATAGMGDVLSGMIGSLLAQKLSPRDAAHLGVYLHGLAGDFGANRLGMPSLTASKLLDFLPDAFADLEIL
jgi:NAD(P)H-hydrate epimerase